jgi:hypothetical protein
MRKTTMIMPSTEFVLISAAIFAGSFALDWIIGGLALKRNGTDTRPSFATAGASAGDLDKAA